jgi:hypothetical protein
MEKVAILLTDEFGDEVLITPIKELPMRVVAELSDLDRMPIKEQYSKIMELLEMASDKTVAQKVGDLTQDQFSKFLERWFIA